MNAKPTKIPHDTESVRYWTWEATHSASAGNGPQKSRLRATISTRVALATRPSTRRRRRLPASGGVR